MTRVEWTYTTETSRLLRWLWLAAFGAIGGFFVLVAALAAWVVAASLLAGEFAVLAVLLAAGLLGARRLATHAVLARDEHGRDAVPSLRALLAASAAWAAGFFALLVLDVPVAAAFACIAVAVVVCLPVGAALSSEGYVDTDEGVFVVDDHRQSLATVHAVSQSDLGPVAVLRVRYHDGAGASAPRLLGVPPSTADRVRDALEASDAEPPDSDRNPAIARALYAFGVGSFALAAAFAYFAVVRSGDAALLGGYVAIFAGVFGVLFAWLGYAEG